MTDKAVCLDFSNHGEEGEHIEEVLPEGGEAVLNEIEDGVSGGTVEEMSEEELNQKIDMLSREISHLKAQLGCNPYFLDGECLILGDVRGEHIKDLKELVHLQEEIIKVREEDYLNTKSSERIMELKKKIAEREVGITELEEKINAMENLSKELPKQIDEKYREIRIIEEIIKKKQQARK